jgi:cellulose synthase/poly-beta-1,6-N-acetylglucosamine synthase-like glycosyltransferase
VYEGKTVAVVVPAYNEEALVGSTVAGIPKFVDRIFVVDDGSTDATAERAREGDKRVEVITREQNEGVGAAIIVGYRRAIQDKIDVTCVMAADGRIPTTSRRSSARSPWTNAITPRRTGSSRGRRGRSSRARATWGTPSFPS